MPLHFSPTRRLQQTAVGGGRLASHLCRPNWLGPQSIDARASSEPVPRSRSHLTRCMAKGVAQSRVADSALPILPSGIGSPTRPSPSHSRLALEERVLTSTRGDAGTACAAGRSKLDTRPGASVLSIHQAPMRVSDIHPWTLTTVSARQTSSHRGRDRPDSPRVYPADHVAESSSVVDDNVIVANSISKSAAPQT